MLFFTWFLPRHDSFDILEKKVSFQLLDTSVAIKKVLNYKVRVSHICSDHVGNITIDVIPFYTNLEMVECGEKQSLIALFAKKMDRFQNGF
jgi:hypothetical protein